MADLVILGAMSGEPFHCLKACDLLNLQEVLDLKLAICKAKGLNPSMLRLFEDKAVACGTSEASSAPLQDNLPLQELWRRQSCLRALVLLPEEEQAVSRSSQCLAADDVQPALQLLQRQAQVFSQLPPELQGDRQLVLEAVTKNWKVLRFCHSDFKDDIEIVRQAMLQNVCALDFASPRLRSTKSLALEAVQLNTSALQHLGPLREDEELLREALRWNPFALRFASPLLANRKDLVLQAVKAEGLALLYAGPEMRGDAEVVRAAVAQNGSALVFADATLKSDRRTVREAVRQNGTALQHAADELQADPELLKEAQRQMGGPSPASQALTVKRGDIFSCVSPRPLRYPANLSPHLTDP